MNIQQLEYIIALDNYRHFAKAAEHCFVTQPTLSMMVHKLEAELGVVIFERHQKPVRPTKEGAEVIRRARLILAEVGHLKAYTAELKGDIGGELRIGIIPTLAPYLLPLFLQDFAQKYPQLKLLIKDMTTDTVIEKLRKGLLDVGLVATPLHETDMVEYPMFYEPFWAYVGQDEKFSPKKYILPTDIDPNKLWLLEEGHCLRNQIFNLCALKKSEKMAQNVQYEAGSIETLIHLVDKNGGVTVVPELSTLHLSVAQKKHLRAFNPPRPTREISLVTAQNYPRLKLIEELRATILSHLPADMTDDNRHALPIHQK